MSLSRKTRYRSGVGQRGGSSPIASTLALDAFSYISSNFAMVGVKKGTGVLANARSTTRYVEDHEGVYQLIAANAVAWHGARYSAGVAYADDGTGTLLDPVPTLDHNPAATNVQIRSNDLADAEWTPTNMTVGDQDEVGLTGAAGSACTLTASAANATLIANTITAASGRHSTKWYIKRKTGTGTVELTLDGGSTWQDITSDIGLSFSGIAVDQGSLTNPQVGIRIVTDTDAVIVANAEAYIATILAIARGSSPIYTTGASVPRGDDVYSLDIANHDNNEVCYFIDAWIPSYDYNEKTNFQKILTTLSGASGAALLYERNTPGDIATYDGVNSTKLSGIQYMQGVSVKLAVIASISDNLLQLCVDGVWSAAVNYQGFIVSSDLLMPSGALYAVRYGRLRRFALTGNVAQKAKIDALMV